MEFTTYAGKMVKKVALTSSKLHIAVLRLTHTK